MAAGDDNRSVMVPIIGAIIVHLALGGGVEGARQLGLFGVKHKVSTVVIEFAPPQKSPPPPPPPPEPEKRPEPPPPPPPEPKTPPKPAPKKVAMAQPAAPPDAPPPVDTPPIEPAPGPPSTEPPAQEYTYQMPAAGPGGGTMGVRQGSAPTGSARGQRGGTGSGGGGADPNATGPKPVSIAAIKREAEPIGDVDRFDPKEYPIEAKRAGISGAVLVRILVDDQGKPFRVRLQKGLGFGLDQKALELAKKLRFRPAVDTNDRPVASEITWTFNFNLPD
jgi:protein TonB